ncbi:hypothetical protein Q9L58_002384 [Maublancomyces gigas]|uniref:Uncharacterized protein n=1 Tax=Discina gigas TaxID=1032678 RepID=A0ABR3GRX9_9PEZI
MSDQADCLPPPAMPVPVPPRTVPAVPAAAAAAKRSSSSSSSSGSGSGARRGSGRRQASSPPTTASRPTSRSRYSPSTSPRTTTKGSPLADAARMPPPPPPPPAPAPAPPPQSSAPRTASLRNRRAANEAPPRRTGRTPSVSAAGGRAKTEDERLALATAASKSLGNALGVGAKPALKGSTGKAPARGRAATVDKAPDGSFGKAMSLRSRTAGKTESTATATGATATATTTTRARAGTGAKRGANAVGATSKQDPSMAAALSGVRRPSTTSLVGTTTASMPPPPPPPAAKGHRRSASGVNATTPPTPTITTTTTTTAAAAISTTTITTATAVPSINANPRPTATAGSTKTKRPAFSALTQDFTVPPNPNPPPSPRSRIVPPPPLDTSTLHAQTQLLQLLTLRSSSAAVYQQLIASATATLKSRFEKLSARHYDARETSAKKQKRHNIDSLAAVVTNVGVVGGSVGGRKRRETTVKSPEERVQAFSEAIKRIDAMRSGEFRVLCTAFGEWIAGYNPRGGGSGSGGRERWIDGIGESWRRECVGVCRRLEVGIVGVDGVAGVLAEHGEVEALVTTVSRVAEGYRELAEGMLEEVEMMGRMENEVVERERMEMGRRVKAILEGGEMEHVYSGQGIWAAG